MTQGEKTAAMILENLDAPEAAFMLAPPSSRHEVHVTDESREACAHVLLD